MSRKNQPTNRTILTSDLGNFKPKIIEVDGELMMYHPKHYRRVFINETGGLTTELSLTPFPDNETAKKGDPR